VIVGETGGRDIMRNAKPLEAMSREGFGSKVITDIIEYQKGIDLPLFKNNKLMIILRLVVGLRGFKGSRVLGGKDSSGLSIAECRMWSAE
jgi:hypothetical protein